MKLTDIVSYLEMLAPPAYQEEYDNAGLIVGHGNDLTGVLVTLDCIEEVIEEAIQRGCNLVVAHHPIVFKGLKRFTGKNYVERSVMKAIKNDVAIYAIHTNLDNMSTGVNHKISQLLELSNTRILSPKPGTLAKLYTFAPKESAGQVRQALFNAGAGSIGKYDQCSYNVEGTGTFRAGEEADPYVGKKGELHTEPEIKIEVVFPRHLKNRVVLALLESHPYEEVAYDIVELANDYQHIGSGMVGELEIPVSQEVFLQKVKDTFGCGVIKYSGRVDKEVERIAVCGGSGFFLLDAAKAAKADVFITSDVKYHEFFDAEDKIILADIGHFESEQFTSDLLVDELKKKFTTFAVLKGNTNTNPVKYF